MKSFLKLLVLWGVKPLDAEKWVFISRRLILRVGGQNIEK